MLSKLKNFESTFHIGQATLIIATFTLISRVVGFARDVLFASHLGASTNSDIYFTAFRIPDLFYNLLILGTLSVAFIPVFSEWYLKDKQRAFNIASTIINISTLGMLIICVLIFIFAKPLTHLLVPGFDPDELAKTVSLTRFMLLSPIIFTISNVLSSVLISLKKFLIVNTAPILYNFGIIFGIIFLYPRYGLNGLAYGVILGALLHVGIQIPETLRYGFRWKPKFDYKDKAVQKIGVLFLPRVIGLDNAYVNLIIVSVVGSTLAAGSITAFNYANNIQAVALGIFALSSAVAVFPIMSELYAKNDTVEFIRTLQRTVIRVLYFIIPITILLLLLRAHVVRLLLGYGRCDWNCTIITFNTLGMLTLALISQSLIPIFARAFYARQNTKIPVAISLVAMAINAVFSYYFAFTQGIVGIALGFVIASTVHCILMFAYLHKALNHKDKASERELNVFDRVLVRQSLKILLASILLGAVSYVTLYLVNPFVDTHRVVGIFVQASIASIAGITVYVITTTYLGIYESEALAKSILKAWRILFKQKSV